jgi:hypothetical protein
VINYGDVNGKIVKKYLMKNILSNSIKDLIMERDNLCVEFATKPFLQKAIWLIMKEDIEKKDLSLVTIVIKVFIDQLLLKIINAKFKDH